MRLNRTVVHNDGTIDTIEQQLQNLQEGKFDPTRPLIVSKNSECLQSFESDLSKPITMKVSTAYKILERHQLDFDFIAKCLNMLDQAVLAFQSMTQPTSTVVLLDMKNEEENYYIVVIRHDKVMNMVNVNEVTSIYDKKNTASFLVRSYYSNCKFYKNKKTEQFFTKSLALQLGQEMNFALSNNYSKATFTKKQVEHDIMQSFFKNPYSNKQVHTSLQDKMIQAKNKKNNILKSQTNLSKELEKEK